MLDINKSKFLFVITETRFWLRQENGNVQYSSPSKPLSEDAVMFCMAVQKGRLCVYIVDGSKYEAPLMLGEPTEYDSEQILALSIMALVKQHDPDVAKQMEDFWFTQGESLLIEQTERSLRYGSTYVGDEDCSPWECCKE